VKDLVERLAALPSLARIPREELEWLAEHGQREVRPAGTVIAPKGERVERLWIILSGHAAVKVDRGAGPRRVMGWRTGEVAGMLPYSRMTGPPGDNYLEEETETLSIHEIHFPEMIQRCPAFTTFTVHLMLDRARSFSASELQDEKMISLGKLAAGLAHELNNPASAAVRGAKLLHPNIDEGGAALRALWRLDLTDEQIRAVEALRAACLDGPRGTSPSPLERADREDEVAEWVRRRGADPAHAAPLADTALTVAELDELAGSIPANALDAALRWIAAEQSTHSLVSDVERAAIRIHELVDTVKRFTYMDNLAGPDFVDLEAGLRDTVKVVAAKATYRNVGITLDIEADLPPVYATGGELNQVWLNLLDNALDAAAGHVEISARLELGRVVVRVIDDGSGIPPDILPRIFDPFFTTKPPGQGIGLGLEITRRLLRQYRGEITIQSRPGRTEVRVALEPAQPGQKVA